MTELYMCTYRSSSRTMDSYASRASLNFLKYSKKLLLRLMKNLVGDMQFAARLHLKSCKINSIKHTLFHVNKLTFFFLIFVFSKFRKIMADTIL